MKAFGVVFCLVAVFVVMVFTAPVLAQEGALEFPQTAEEIEAFFEKRKPAARTKELRAKGVGRSETGTLKGITDELVDDDAALEDLPKVGALIHFDFDSATIKRESYPLLKEFATALQRRLEETVVIIAGHTDSVGREGYNLELSERRAAAVKEFLVLNSDINSGRLFLKAYGEQQPIASNLTDSGRALNRRVEFMCVW
ncbi:OmpA family protein [candidate division KSB3 bacterium]|uniref:OmpA family protein n=1 Tax=candidate division KSB3 bacterium TaxID=2044937 RepID=A0A9D5JY71_9BACT|nr:OmpA family protein [candidate division KSB3 bacterium]MBD3326002.1 OmpA family protein [candidate division KSB3 bacterium]